MSSEPGKWMVGSVYLVMAFTFALVSIKAWSDTGNPFFSVFMIPSALLAYSIIDGALQSRRLHSKKKQEMLEEEMI